MHAGGRGESPSTASDHVGGVASDEELLVRGDDERQDRASGADAPLRVPAVAGIGLGVLSEAEETQPAEYQATDDSAVLPDAAGEDQRVKPLQADHQPCDRLGKPVHENL